MKLITLTIGIILCRAVAPIDCSLELPTQIALGLNSGRPSQGAIRNKSKVNHQLVYLAIIK